ncbi:adenylosuccinate synthetase, partial [Clostridioides difficile]|uniref:adenylosuccinate synthetase n=1 Tax=Clostridioides difficile TaxID=1496 RepID=UPI00155A18A3
FDPKGFLEELEMFKTDNISTENIKISDRAHVIFPYHKELDAFPGGMTKAQYLQFRLNSIIEEGEGYDLLVMGRSEGEGCYC